MERRTLTPFVGALGTAFGTLFLLACSAQNRDGSEGATSRLNSNAAEVPVTIVDNRGLENKKHSDADVIKAVRSALDLSAYREAKAEEIPDADGSSHFVVQLLTEGLHSLEVVRVDVDKDLKVQDVTRDYVRTADEEVHGTAVSSYACPDPSVQFVAFCPNYNTLEINITNDVANAAEAAGLKTVRLLKRDATHDAWLNYMQCPKLIGNFYDGDANPNEVVVYNGAITAREFASSVNFKLQTTNIWLACQAYKEPMLTSVQTTAKSQKYAAGKNNLLVGPSDKAAACAMKAAIAGSPMTAAFQSCYQQLNTTSDKWGFGGDGADIFGTLPTAPPPLPLADAGTL